MGPSRVTERGSSLSGGRGGVTLMEMCREFTPPKNLKCSDVLVVPAGVI